MMDKGGVFGDTVGVYFRYQYTGNIGDVLEMLSNQHQGRRMVWGVIHSHAWITQGNHV